MVHTSCCARRAGRRLEHPGRRRTPRPGAEIARTEAYYRDVLAGIERRRADAARDRQAALDARADATRQERSPAAGRDQGEAPGPFRPDALPAAPAAGAGRRAARRRHARFPALPAAPGLDLACPPLPGPALPCLRQRPAPGRRQDGPRMRSLPVPTHTGPYPASDEARRRGCATPRSRFRRRSRLTRPVQRVPPRRGRRSQPPRSPPPSPLGRSRRPRGPLRSRTVVAGPGPHHRRSARDELLAVRGQRRAAIGEAATSGLARQRRPCGCSASVVSLLRRHSAGVTLVSVAGRPARLALVGVLCRGVCRPARSPPRSRSPWSGSSTATTRSSTRSSRTPPSTRTRCLPAVPMTPAPPPATPRPAGPRSTPWRPTLTDEVLPAEGYPCCPRCLTAWWRIDGPHPTDVGPTRRHGGSDPPPGVVALCAPDPDRGMRGTVRGPGRQIKTAEVGLKPRLRLGPDTVW